MQEKVQKGDYQKKKACDGTCYRYFFLIAIFIMLQKILSAQKNQISCTGSKVPIWKNWKIARKALLIPCMKFEKKKPAKSIPLKRYENGNEKKYS